MTRTLGELRARVNDRLFSRDRFVDARLGVRTLEGETLFAVGGRWDRVKGRFITTDCPVHWVTLKPAQVPFGRAIGNYITARLAGDESRPALLMALGNRGSGKTWLLGLLFTCIALALPRTWQIGCSITARQSRELKAAIGLIGPRNWIAFDTDDFRDMRTVFVTGSAVLWLTGRNPKALRQALLRFEHVAINEAQDQTSSVFTNAIGAIRSGGVVSAVGNPPQDDSGDWVVSLYQGLEADNRDGLAFIIQNEGNDAISRPTMQKIGRLLRIVDPNAADADDLGLIKLSGTVGYPGYSKLPRREESGRWVSGHVGNPPATVQGIDGHRVDGWIDETRRITAEHSGTGEGFDFVGGSDFQADPGSCAAIGKLYLTPAGDIVLWIKETVGVPGSENDLTFALNARGYFPGNVDHDGSPASSLLLIGDATGARQNAEHRKRDPYSFTRLRADGWNVLPPFFYRNRGGERTPMNPLVADSRKQMKALFTTGKILLSPACSETHEGFPSLIESFSRVKVNVNGKFEKAGAWTHLPDGVRYLAWRFLDRGIPKAPSKPFDMETFEAIRSIQLFGSGR